MVSDRGGAEFISPSNGRGDYDVTLVAVAGWKTFGVTGGIECIVRHR